jgi:hypothetical protein
VTSNAARSYFFAEQSGKRAKMLFGQKISSEAVGRKSLLGSGESNHGGG